MNDDNKKIMAKIRIDYNNVNDNDDDDDDNNNNNNDNNNNEHYDNTWILQESGKFSNRFSLFRSYKFNQFVS